MGEQFIPFHNSYQETLQFQRTDLQLLVLVNLSLYNLSREEGVCYVLGQLLLLPHMKRAVNIHLLRFSRFSIFRKRELLTMNLSECE